MLINAAAETWETPMSEKDDVKVAVEDLASSISNFKFLRTFRLVLKNQGKLGNAIVARDFDNILTPNKYFSTSVTLAGAGILLWQWATGDGGCSAWGYNRPLPYIVVAFAGLPLGFTQLFYLRYSVSKQIGRMPHVLAKLSQCYAFVIGSILGLFGVALLSDVIFKIVHPPHTHGNWAATIFGALLTLLIIVAVVAIPWIFLVAPPRIIATIYGLKAGKAWKASLLGLAAGFLGLCLGLSVYSSFHGC